MTDLEFYQHNSSDVLELMDLSNIPLSETKGIIADGVWKKKLQQIYGDGVIIPPQGDECDARRVETNRPADVKLCGRLIVSQHPYPNAAYVYLSYDEYQLGKEEDTIYVVYWMKDGQARRVSTFTFSEAKEACAFEVFEKGRWVLSKRTGKLQPPWSIDILKVNMETQALLC